MKRYGILLMALVLSCSQKNPAAENNANHTAVENNQVPESAKPVNTVAAIPAPVTQKNQIRFDFEKAAVGSLPAGWSAHKTGPGNDIKWEVVQDGTNKVLGQLTKSNPNSHFNVVTYDSLSAKNVHLKTRFKSISGRMDQGGGFVWRYQNPENYYLVRANSLEGNVVLYKVQNGKRTDLPLVGKGRTYGADAKVPTKTWHDLELEARDNLFIVSINGKELFRVNDTTFTGAGKVGFWTKSDAYTYFDNFEINVLP
jgi:hypothetical protein